MSLENLFEDLIAVPGVHGAIFFQPKESPKRYWQEETEWQPPGDKFMRGAGQMIRRLCSSHDRVELRYQRGRFIIKSLGEGIAVGCFTDRDLNLPLLNLTLDELVQMAQSVEFQTEPAPTSSSVVVAPQLMPPPTVSDPAASRTIAPIATAPEITETTIPQPELHSQPVRTVSQTTVDHSGEELPGEIPRTAFSPNGSTLDVSGNLPEELHQENDSVREAEAGVTDDQIVNAGERLADLPAADEEDEIISLMPKGAADQMQFEEQAGEEFAEPLATHGSIAAGLSDLSLIATGYLGRSFVVTAWRETQPAAFQPAFQILPDGMIEAENDLAVTDQSAIELAAEWALAFVARCQLVTIDLPLHLVAPINADAQALLTVGNGSADRGLILLQSDYLRRLAGPEGQATEPASQQVAADEAAAIVSNCSDESWAG